MCQKFRLLLPLPLLSFSLFLLARPVRTRVTAASCLTCVVVVVVIVIVGIVSGNGVGRRLGGIAALANVRLTQLVNNKSNDLRPGLLRFKRFASLFLKPIGRRLPLHLSLPLSLSPDIHICSLYFQTYTN